MDHFHPSQGLSSDQFLSSFQEAALYYSYHETEYAPFQTDTSTFYYHPILGTVVPVGTSPRISNYSTLIPPSPIDDSSSDCQSIPSVATAVPSSGEQMRLLETRPDIVSIPPELAGQDTSEHDHEFAAQALLTEDSGSLAPDTCERKVEHPDIRLNQRKAHFKALSDNVGFTITDPDTIPSHNKKRSYLESLEEYIQWLRLQIQLAGAEPLPIQRVLSHRGLTNHSLRTILVHKQSVLRELNCQKTQAEEKFMDLQNTLLGVRIGTSSGNTRL